MAWRAVLDAEGREVLGEGKYIAAGWRRAPACLGLCLVLSALQNKTTAAVDTPGTERNGMEWNGTERNGTE